MWNDIKKKRPCNRELVLVYVYKNHKWDVSLAEYFEGVHFYYHDDRTGKRRKSIICYQFKMYFPRNKDVFISEKSVKFWAPFRQFLLMNQKLFKETFIGYNQMGLVIDKKTLDNLEEMDSFIEKIKRQKDERRKVLRKYEKY